MIKCNNKQLFIMNNKLYYLLCITYFNSKNILYINNKIKDYEITSTDTSIFA